MSAGGQSASAEGQEAAQPLAAGEKPIKPAMLPKDLFPTIGLNMFFITCAMTDYSIFLWGNSVSDGSRLHFLGQHRQWDSTKPIIAVMMIPILLTLPFAIYNFSKEALSSILGWTRASPWRHAADIGQCIILCFCILPTVFTKALPLSGHIATVCVPGEKGVIGPECQEACTGMQTIMGWMVVLNICMFACDITRYNVGALPGAAAAAKKAE